MRVATSMLPSKKNGKRLPTGLPQINAGLDYQNNFEIQKVVFGDQEIELGSKQQ